MGFVKLILAGKAYQSTKKGLTEGLSRRTPEEIAEEEKRHKQFLKQVEEENRLKNQYYASFKKDVKGVYNKTNLYIDLILKFNEDLKKSTHLDQETNEQFSNFINSFDEKMTLMKKITNGLITNKSYIPEKVNQSKENISKLIKQLSDVSSIIRKETKFSEKITKKLTKRHGSFYRYPPIATQEKQIIEYIKIFNQIYAKNKFETISLAKKLKKERSKDPQKVVSEGIRHMDRLHQLFNDTVSKFIRGYIGDKKEISVEIYYLKKRKEFFGTERYHIALLRKYLKNEEVLLIQLLEQDSKRKNKIIGENIKINNDHMLKSYQIVKGFYEGLS
ncbi:hypothetical protein HN385_01495 [archaeon]|jgi:transcriptional regulator with PAS, ATPase and Fis domain|nr:hypothetical protein [archaeon]MBT3451315.1 hypothetical protein [archaeon]MBT6869369.1 hypothetical protein [archaeon]MBT7192532.1 hypothetical protein [archaeon]MBT7380608.1 hypothetical protein [archaeon]